MFGHHLGTPPQGICGLLRSVSHYYSDSIGYVLHSFLSCGSLLDEGHERGPEEAKVETAGCETEKPEEIFVWFARTFLVKNVSRVRVFLYKSDY